MDVATFGFMAAASAIGGYIAFVGRWYTVEKPERKRMERESQERELRKLDEVKRAEERDG